MKKIPKSRLRRIRTWLPGENPGELTEFGKGDSQIPMIDLASNDYLGLSKHPEIIKAASLAMNSQGIGSGSSRLITGSRPIHLELEESLAKWLGREKVFLFPSGFQANIAAVIALANRKTFVLADRFIHHSLLVGIKASGAKLKRFAHNDLNDLERLLCLSKREQPNESALVITESLFSMEGTSPDLKAITELCKKFEAKLLVDEAHALGIMGHQGKGLCYGIEQPINIISGTFGKAFGSGGAFLATDQNIAKTFIQNCGGFLYTTALAPPLAAAALCALKLIQANSFWGGKLQEEAQLWRQSLSFKGWQFPLSNGPIIPLLIGTDEKALHYQKHLESQGILSIAIRPPTVPEGTSRLRLVIRKDLPKSTLTKLINSLHPR